MKDQRPQRTLKRQLKDTRENLLQEFHINRCVIKARRFIYSVVHYKDQSLELFLLTNEIKNRIDGRESKRTSMCVRLGEFLKTNIGKAPSYIISENYKESYN